METGPQKRDALVVKALVDTSKLDAIKAMAESEEWMDRDLALVQLKEAYPGLVEIFDALIVEEGAPQVEIASIPEEMLKPLVILLGLRYRLAEDREDNLRFHLRCLQELQQSPQATSGDLQVLQAKVDLIEAELRQVKPYRLAFGSQAIVLGLEITRRETGAEHLITAEEGEHLATRLDRVFEMSQEQGDEDLLFEEEKEENVLAIPRSWPQEWDHEYMHEIPDPTEYTDEEREISDRLRVPKEVISK